MKTAVSYLLSFLVVGIYIVSTMGFGIHECAMNGTKETVVLFGNDPCETAHNAKDDSGVKCCGCGCCKMSWILAESADAHDGQCCTTEVYVLSHDQVNSQQLSSEMPDVSNADILLPEDLNCKMLAKASVFTGIAYPSGFVKALAKCDLLVSISQFRI